MCRVRAMRICPWLILVLAACIDNAGAAIFELCRYCVDDGAYEGCEERKHEYGQRFGDFFDQSLQTRDLLDCGRDGSNDFISEFQYRLLKSEQDKSENLMTRVFLQLPATYIYLGSCLHWIKTWRHTRNTRAWRSSDRSWRSIKLWLCT